MRAELPSKAHRRASRRLGNAEIQTIARQASSGVGLAERCSPARTQAIRPLAPAPHHHPRPTRGSRMTGDRHVRFYESRRVRLPPATHLTLAGIGGTLQFIGGVASTTNVPPHSIRCSAGAPREWCSTQDVRSPFSFSDSVIRYSGPGKVRKSRSGYGGLFTKELSLERR